MNNYLIIGHSSGIGAAISQKLSLDNRVFGTYFQHPPTVTNDNTSSHLVNVLDDNIDLSFLPATLDGLIYCPGAISLKPFSRIKEEDFINDFKLQVTGAIKIIQACLPKMKNSEAASIILFSTVAVQTGFNFHSMVSTSKGAIEGLTKALAAEFAPKIRVNCIAPSITNTPLANNLLNTPDKIDANAQRHPLKKIGSAETIADAALFLLKDTSSWITGQILHVDGGIGSIK